MKGTGMHRLLVLVVLTAFACGGDNPIGSDMEENDRDVLVRFYNATNGPNWMESRGWLSDRPLAEWYGVGANASGEVIEIVLRNNNLAGVLPSVLSELESLEVLELDINRITGPVPNWLTAMTGLRILNLAQNNMAGEIPSSLSQMTSLEVLDLDHNGFTGTIPASLGQISGLGKLDVHENMLTGTVPDEIGNLKNLYYIALDGNGLTGKIPGSIVGIPLTWFWWGENDGLCLEDSGDGTVSDWLGTLSVSSGPICGAE